MPFHPMLILSLTCIGVAIAVVVYLAVATPAVVAPCLGERGRKRRTAMEQGGPFRTLEPVIRKIAGWIARVDLERQRAALDELLRRTGYAFGITPDEMMAVMVLSGIASALVCALMCKMTQMPLAAWVPMALLIGTGLPYLQTQEAMRERFKKIGRGLPPAIDLVSLCMGAGADFPSALRFVVKETIDTRDPVREEFQLILQQLEVGHTRAYALRMFAHRVPTDAVRDFVGAVVQAEEKGNPLAEVLTIQARMLRMRRSVAAEEAAARAGVLLIGPLMVLLGAILVLLFGPFAVNGIGF